ncbi:alpha/beta hydrolase family protein [Thalassotalea maritima]|uniref:alpha/beta hydrolase family protein n=1 Tax=Thalassotalea maritima TaxID=3242416 RepID=UPI0035294574
MSVWQRIMGIVGSIALLLTSLSGCNDAISLPQAQPLSASSEQLMAIPFIDKGPYQVIINRDVTLHNPDLQRDLDISAFYPEQGQQFPLVIFSPGFVAHKDTYDNVIAYWVSHGFVVLAVNHQDCCSMVSGIIKSMWFGNFGLVEQRVNDVRFLQQSLAELVSQYPFLQNKFDAENLAIAGHSFGGFTAQLFAGAGTYNPDDERYHYIAIDNVKAVLAISPPGPMFDVITDKSWQKLSLPTFISTGTWDVDGRFFKTWQVHNMSFDTALPGDKYSLVTQGADHYFGNLICRPEREELPQHDALRMLNATSTLFLKSYLTDEVVSKQQLQTLDLGGVTNGFSTLTRR